MSRMNEGDGGMAGQLKDKVGEVADNLREAGSHASQAAREKLQHARESAREYYERGRDRAKEIEGDLEDYVRDQPIKALLMAAGIGVLVGILWRRH